RNSADLWANRSTGLRGSTDSGASTPIRRTLITWFSRRTTTVSPSTTRSTKAVGGVSARAMTGIAKMIRTSGFGGAATMRTVWRDSGVGQDGVGTLDPGSPAALYGPKVPRPRRVPEYHPLGPGTRVRVWRTSYDETSEQRSCHSVPRGW